MDQSYSESDVSLSPSKIFERLQMLRQLQIMQRGKLQKHHLQCQDSPEISSSVTEIVSHFSNSTSYNTFRSLLQSSQEVQTADNSCIEADVSPRKDIDQDYIEGVSALNLSQESEFLTNSPISSRSATSKVSKMAMGDSQDMITTTDKCNEMSRLHFTAKKQISLDEMPILSPKKDFEELLIEKLKSEKSHKNKSPKKIQQIPSNSKKPFLKRGEGMARFGLQKTNLVIQNTKALPWRQSKKSVKPMKTPLKSKEKEENGIKKNKDMNVQIVVPEPKVVSPVVHSEKSNIIQIKSPIVIEATTKEGNNHNTNSPPVINEEQNKKGIIQSSTSNLSEISKRAVNNKPLKTQGLSNGKHPVKSAKGQTWASVLTNEQDLFLRQLKQSDYYKNFVSPAKSTISDSSCNETPLKLQQDRETVEQKMFELLENKVTHESFNLNNSFFTRFLRRNNLECSGESTPLVLQRCLYDNPGLLHLHHKKSLENRNRNESCCDGDTCSDCTECSETCSSVSTCCSCNKDPTSKKQSHSQHDKEETIEDTICTKINEKKEEGRVKEKCLDDSVKKDNATSADMAEMNAKLIATSELLKERLKELEDEIETFRKENASLTKSREELDLERQKFYEEKTIFEQKYNEEKILSEYYLAEEKEKLNKQKQTYDRYVREMRGRLSKKEKDEVTNLKKEIADLKDEIRNKDAKSTSTIARLRNQIKILEKERNTLKDEIEKLKKENRRIQHSNDITRRLTNLKYLEQINKKLTHMSSKDIHSETDIDSNQKYKVFEIERQSRVNKTQPVSNKRRRAKSVPNLNVTSRYAKYFSKKDTASDKDANILIHKHFIPNVESDTEEENKENEDLNDSCSLNENDSDEENNLERIYNERFQSCSPKNNQESDKSDTKSVNKYHSSDGFFIQRSNSNSRSLDRSSKSSLSPHQVDSIGTSENSSKPSSVNQCRRSHRNSKSPIYGVKHSEDYNTVKQQKIQNVDSRPKSPVSILSNRISGFQKPATIVNKDMYFDKSLIPSPEPSSSRSSVTKTNLNPMEIRKPDGSKELRFPNGNVKHISADGKYSKFIYYNGDVKENFFDEGKIKYFYAETKTYHTTHADGLEVLEFSDGQVEKRYKDGSSEIRLPNGSVRYYDPKNEHVREEWRFPDGTALTVSANGEQRIVFSNGQVEVHATDHKRREFPDGTVKLVYNDGTSETRYASGRVRIKDKHGNLIMDSGHS